jgi:hypothetical protein
MNRAEIHSTFVNRFFRASAGKQANVAELDNVEKHFGVLYPSAYREFVLKYGAISAGFSMLGIIVKNEAELWDIQSFFSPRECVSSTEMYHSGGMSSRLVAFAMDSMANVFCFERNDLTGTRQNDVPVWFFDHDFCTDSRLSDSFDSWLSCYLELK